MRMRRAVALLTGPRRTAVSGISTIAARYSIHRLAAELAVVYAALSARGRRRDVAGA